MLKEGDTAPDFNLQDADETPHRLRDYKGKTVVVYFYPKDNTPGCTREAQGFSALAKKFAAAGIQVLGISKDSAKSHCSFRDKYELKFPLLSDPELAAQKAFGAYGEKKSYGKTSMGTIRSTFIINPKGKVARVFPKVTVDGHPEAVFEAAREIAKSHADK